MKKTGKAELGHHTRLEKTSKQTLAGRAAPAAKWEAGKKEIRSRRQCG